MNDEEIRVLQVYCEKQKKMIGDLVSRVLHLETQLDMFINKEEKEEETPPEKKLGQRISKNSSLFK